MTVSSVRARRLGRTYPASSTGPEEKEDTMGTSFLERLRGAFTPKGIISTRAGLVVSVTSFAILLAGWWFITARELVNPMFVPTPAETAHAAVDMFRRGFVEDIWATVYRVMAGFLIATAVALPLGIFVGTYAPVSSFVQPMFSFIRYMPASAFIPLFIFWIGIGEEEKIAIIILGSLPQLVLMIANNIRSVTLPLIEASYTLGTNQANVLWKIILPRAWPDIVDTLRIVLGWAWTYVIVAEIVGASSGIGYTILQSQRSVAVDQIFVSILTLGLIGLIVDYALIFLNRMLFPWNERRH
ncbi:ABC transporter permease [Actinomyces sp.]|uniref:ABC transporter permease n=1 Tax=Actinomyces sp. TaxID=29317 RepID=UPI00289E5A99|nr:ABC transporter permease [Actinomyces sp.]